MYYYKNTDATYYASSSPITREDLVEIAEEEYNALIEERAKLEQPTEAEIRAEKEAQLHQLLRELYPDEEG